MAQILVRGLDDNVRDRLRALARERGQSVEETVRGILRNAVHRKPKATTGLGSRIAAQFKGCGLREKEITELRGQPVSPPEFR